LRYAPHPQVPLFPFSPFSKTTTRLPPSCSLREFGAGSALLADFGGACKTKLQEEHFFRRKALQGVWGATCVGRSPAPDSDMDGGAGFAGFRLRACGANADDPMMPEAPGTSRRLPRSISTYDTRTACPVVNCRCHETTPSPQVASGTQPLVAEDVASPLSPEDQRVMAGLTRPLLTSQSYQIRITRHFEAAKPRSHETQVYITSRVKKWAQ
jgi:hypothetical protein